MNRLPVASVRSFCEEIFSRMGFTAEEAFRITDVLLLADLYGIESHGVQRLIRYHNSVKAGSTHVGSRPEVVFESPVSAVIDGRDGMGQLIAWEAAELAIRKAKSAGMAIVTVRTSNHFGIAGYYTKMAADAGLIGLAMTNTEPIMVHTHASAPILGTNPIAMAVPAQPYPFWFDAATTVVPRGKLEVYNKQQKAMPDNWAVDENGVPCTDASRVLDNIIAHRGGGILPVGGAEEASGSHKGYGFAMMCEIFTAILSGGATSNQHVRRPGHGAGTCHCFMVIDPAAFGDAEGMIRRMSQLLTDLRSARKAEGAEHIYTHGEKEAHIYEENLREGIRVNEKTLAEMQSIAAELGVDFNQYF